MWLVDLDRLPRLPRLLRPLARFDARDHFARHHRPSGPAWNAILAAQGIDLAGGRVLMLTHARVLGHVFNPLTLYWCHGADGALRCVVAEVHNTYGERHCYLLHTDARRRGRRARRSSTSRRSSPSTARYRMRLPVAGRAAGG